MPWGECSDIDPSSPTTTGLVHQNDDHDHNWVWMTVITIAPIQKVGPECNQVDSMIHQQMRPEILVYMFVETFFMMAL